MRVAFDQVAAPRPAGANASLISPVIYRKRSMSAIELRCSGETRTAPSRPKESSRGSVRLHNEPFGPVRKVHSLGE